MQQPPNGAVEGLEAVEALEALVEAVRPAGEPGVLPCRLFRYLKALSKREPRVGGKHQKLTKIRLLESFL